MALTEETLERLVGAIPDPEIPVVTIADLGILQAVRVAEDGAVTVDITPTYSGCPAMKMIEQEIIAVLENAGVGTMQVNLVLSPAWSTDWISEDGRRKMKEFGIAPPGKTAPPCAPQQRGGDSATVSVSRQPPTFRDTLFEQPDVQCPRCDSRDTRQLSAFGSTACKSLWQCNHCHEPFDHFKCH